MYFEYYDSPSQYIVYCAQGYVVTGMSKKINPYTKEYRYDWIQCCRVGFGQPVAHRPPVTYMPSGVPAYHDQGGPSSPVTAAYQSQYRKIKNEEEMDLDFSIQRTKARFADGSDGLRKADQARQLDVKQPLVAARRIRNRPEEGFELEPLLLG
jgi:hypothetical protein